MAFWNNIVNALNNELPPFNSLDEGIDELMKDMRRFSEGLHETEFYLNTRWREVRDDIEFQETVLHVFKEGGVYLRILDGDIATGNWEQTIGGLVIKFSGKHELYELVFLNEDFFILRKHGNQALKGRRKYFFMAREAVARRREWVDLLDLMYEIYKGNSNYVAVVIVVLLVIAVVVFFSIM